jgi:hypothetical protein
MPPFEDPKTLATKRRAATVVAALIQLAGIAVTQPSFADKGNSDFGRSRMSGPPAVADQPGSSSAAIYYHSPADAQANKDPVLGGVIDAGVVNEFFGPTYRLETPALTSVGLLGLAGYFEGVIGATLTGPLGQTMSGSLRISVTPT